VVAYIVLISGGSHDGARRIGKCIITYYWRRIRVITRLLIGHIAFGAVAPFRAR